ncbi:MAG: Vms1/Ankzf1 family peptidyl-tRNA hydrolase, partial [Actinomycetes bacterium]
MDVSFLERVFAAPGPYATVCADVTHNTESADAEVELRVRALTEQLTEQGAPEQVVQTVRDRLLEANDGGEAGTLRGRALVVASDGSVVLDDVLADRPRQELADWGPQPNLLPVLGQLAGRIPHVVVIADRVGADLSVASVPGKPVEETEIDGSTLHLHRVQVGGWAHLRYQHRAENQWTANMDKVAEQIGSIVRRQQPAFVLLAGEVRARQILADRASGVWSDLVVSIEEGGRPEGADREVVQERASRLVDEHAARAIADVVEKIEAAGAHGLAVTGTEAVVDALRKGQVETLVLADEPEDEKLLVGDEPLTLGVNQHDMDALGTHGTVVPH